MTSERIEAGTGDKTEAPAEQPDHSKQEGANITPTAQNTAPAQPDKTPESLGLQERLTRASAKLSTQTRYGRQTKISQIVDWLVKHDTDVLPQEVIALIMGERKIDPGTRLKIQGIQNETFQKVNISFRRNPDGSVTIIPSNPHHQKWNDKQPKPTPASRAPYAPPTLTSQTHDTRHSRAELSIETTAQLHQASLATRDEIRSALIKVLDTPKSRGQTSLGITRDDGTTANTQTYFLEKFLKANPIPQEELEKGFPSTQQLSAAKKNTNNNPYSVIKSQALRISTAHNFIQPEKSEWIIESTRVQYSSDPKVKEANKIYATAKQIKETPSLFSKAPQFSQFIFGALTGLTMGATLEEFFIVTGLTEEAIMEAVNHINTSVIPEGIDLKIHNRNGVLIFGTRPAVILLDTPETREVTIDWKTIILAIRKAVANTEAIESDADTKTKHADPTTIATAPQDTEPAQIESAQQSVQEKLALILQSTLRKGRKSKFLEKLLENKGELSITEIKQIQQASDSKTILSAFISNTKRILNPHGITLTTDKVKKVIRLEPFPEKQDKEPAPKDLTTILTKIIKNHRTSESSKKVLKALIENSEGIPAATITEIIEESGMQSPLSMFIFNINRSLRKHDLALILDKNTGIVQVKGIKQNTDEPISVDEPDTTPEQTTAELKKQAPTAELLARARSARDEIEAKNTEIATLQANLAKVRETLTQVHATATRNARHDTRIEVTAEFAEQIEELKTTISNLRNKIRSLSARQAHQLMLSGQRNPNTAEARTTTLARSLADEEIAKKDELIAELEKDKATLQTALTHETAQAKPELTEDTRRTIANLRAEVERHRRELIASDLLSNRIQTLEAQNAELRAQLQGKTGKKKNPSKRVGHSYGIPRSIPPALTDQGHRFEPQPTSTQPKTPATSENTQSITVSNIGNFTFNNIFTLRKSIISALKALGENLTLDNIRTLKASLESVHEDPSTKASHKPIIMKYLEILQRKLDLIPKADNGRNILSKDEYTKLIAATNTLV